MFLFPKVLSSHFLGQTWTQNLKFFKLTKIWYRGRLLYAYFSLFIFSKNFGSYFLNKFSPKIRSSLNKLKLDAGIHWYKLITILVLNFSIFFHSYHFNQILAKTNVLLIDSNLIQGHIFFCLFRTKKKLKILALDYNLRIILTMYTNARFQSTGTKSDLGPNKWYEWQNFWKNKH